MHGSTVEISQRGVLRSTELARSRAQVLFSKIHTKQVRGGFATRVVPSLTSLQARDAAFPFAQILERSFCAAEWHLHAAVPTLRASARSIS